LFGVKRSMMAKSNSYLYVMHIRWDTLADVNIRIAQLNRLRLSL